MNISFNCLLFLFGSLVVHLSSSLPTAGLRDPVSHKSSSLQGESRLSFNAAGDVHSAQNSFSDWNVSILSSTSRSPMISGILGFPFPVSQLLGFTGFEPEHFFSFCAWQCSSITGQSCNRRKTPLKMIKTCKKSTSFGFMDAPNCCFWSSCFNLVGVAGMKEKENGEIVWLNEARKRACKGKQKVKPNAWRVSRWHSS